MRTASFLFAAIALFLCPQSLSAQNETSQRQAGLRLGATVTSLVVERQSWGATCIVVGLRYELSNTGTTNVILWKRGNISDVPWPYTFVGKDLSRTKGFGDRELLASQIGGPSFSDAPEWASMRNALDQPAPPPDATITLLPNQSSVFDEEVTIVAPHERPRTFPDHPTFLELEKEGTFWLRVRYEVWSFNLEHHPRGTDKLKFGRTLQRRWKEFGTLLLDDIYTEPVRIDLKTVSYKPVTSARQVQR